MKFVFRDQKFKVPEATYVLMVRQPQDVPHSISDRLEGRDSTHWSQDPLDVLEQHSEASGDSSPTGDHEQVGPLSTSLGAWELICMQCCWPVSGLLTAS